jgi:hypothetical protein
MDIIYIIFLLILVTFVVLMVFSKDTKELPKFGIGLILVVFTMFLLKVIPVNCCASEYMEGFQATQNTSVTKCPGGTTTYTDNLGNVNCCRGEVNGSMCNGTVECTFSSSTGGKYPTCIKKSLRRKWFRGIDSWVMNFMSTDAADRFGRVVSSMQYIYDISKKLDKTKIPQGAIDRYKVLVDEEVEWFKEAQSQKVTDEIVYQEEIMYIVNEMMNILNTYKIDQTYVQSQAYSTMCSAKK